MLLIWLDSALAECYRPGHLLSRVLGTTCSVLPEDLRLHSPLVCSYKKVWHVAVSRSPTDPQNKHPSVFSIFKVRTLVAAQQAKCLFPPPLQLPAASPGGSPRTDWRLEGRADSYKVLNSLSWLCRNICLHALVKPHYIVCTHFISHVHQQTHLLHACASMLWDNSIHK